MNWFSNDFILKIIILLILSSDDVVADDDYFVDDLNTVTLEITSVDELLKLGCEFEFFDSNPSVFCSDQFAEVIYLLEPYVFGRDVKALPDRIIAKSQASFCSDGGYQKAIWIPLGMIRVESIEITTITVVYYLSDSGHCVIKFDYWT